MRIALRTKSRVVAGQTAQSKSYPAPIDGWNTRDSIAAMKPTEAVALDNFFPKPSYVEGRGGSADHATGMTGNGKTLMVYTPLTGVQKMYCSTSSGIYDVSSPGAVGASKIARTNGKHIWLNFGDGTNNYLIMVNGVDKPVYFDGTTWTAVDNASTPALTGLTTTSIASVFASKTRLFFIQKDSLSFWYLSAGVAGGALTRFDLSSVAKKGGYLMAGGNWSVDAGDGPDDRVVFVTSEGECIIYGGSNPSNSASWALTGVYDIGRPLGRKCMTKYGADLLVITERGVFPMLAAIKSPEEQSKFALSFKIEPTFTTSGSTYGTNYGWTAVLYPAQSALIVNIPIAEDGEHEQYVMNTITKAWCKFKEWDAEDFAVFSGNLYFTTGTKVVKAWSGTGDNNVNIIYYGKSAFSYFDSIGEQKRFVLYRPVLNVNGSLSFLTDIDVDFKDTAITGSATYTVVAGGIFGTSAFGSSYFAAGTQIVKSWTSPDEYPGYCAAGKIQIENKSLTIQWVANDYVYQKGGIL
jgi:hypothetical protein